MRLEGASGAGRRYATSPVRHSKPAPAPKPQLPCPYASPPPSPWCGPLPTCTTTAVRLYSVSGAAGSSEVVLASLSSMGNTTRYISLRILKAGGGGGQQAGEEEGAEEGLGAAM